MYPRTKRLTAGAAAAPRARQATTVATATFMVVRVIRYVGRLLDEAFLCGMKVESQESINEMIVKERVTELVFYEQ